MFITAGWSKPRPRTTKLRARPNDVSIAMKPNIVAREH